jgi:hypothetical protein
MSDLFFVIRMVIITAVLLIVMQIKVGTVTIERSAQEWMHSSSMIASLQKVAGGAVKFLSQGYKTVATSIDSGVGKVFHSGELPGSRISNAFHRSTGFMKSHADSSGDMASRAPQIDSSSSSDSSDVMTEESADLPAKNHRKPAFDPGDDSLTE